MERLTRWNGKKYVLPQGHGMWRLIAETLAKYEDEEEKGCLLHLPCPEGTPVVRLKYNQHDRYWEELGFFRLSDLPVFGYTVFLTKKEADAKMKELAG